MDPTSDVEINRKVEAGVREESEGELQLIWDLPSQKNTQPLKYTNTQPLV